MKITARLAITQIKLNRKRTIGAIFAIMLSTALVTAVMCFATSGNAMLVGLLGEGYGEYGQAYRMMIFVPAAILGLMIFFMSVTVISNIFRISANQRIKQFGVLKCVGGTSRQVKESVIYESICLSAIGIPLGLLLGVGLGAASIALIGQYIDYFNDLQKSIVMSPISVSLSFVVNPLTFIIAALFSFFTVLFSAYKPAKKAGKITALECIKGLGEIKVKEEKARSHRIAKKIFGFEGLLAARNLCRNRQSYKSTIRTLSIGIVLILSTFSLAIQAKGIEEYMNPGMDDVMVDYSSNHTSVTDKTTGLELSKYSKPINSELAQKVTEKLSAFNSGTEITGVGDNTGKYGILLEEKNISKEMKEDITPNKDGKYAFKVELICVDRDNYRKLCEKAGVPVGSNILLNYYSYNNNGRIKDVKPFKNISKVSLNGADGSKKEINVSGELTKDEALPGMYGIGSYPFRILVENTDVRFYDWFANPDNEQEYIEYAKKVTDEFFKTTSDDPYTEEGFLVKISRVDTLVKILNIAIVVAEVILYGFVILLLLIGLASVISTLSTNVITRAREFAVLKSVGMTTEELSKMLITESILCTVKASVKGVPLGITIPWLINLSIRKMFPVLYTIPFGIVLISVAVICVLVLSITMFNVCKLKKQNIIETIRMETM